MERAWGSRDMGGRAESEPISEYSLSLPWNVNRKRCLGPGGLAHSLDMTKVL